VDVGVATRKGEDVKVRVYSGTSVLTAGSATDRIETIGRLLSPLSQQEVGTIRCIGLNYVNHAKEANMALPNEPVLFMCVQSIGIS
jgi:2-keto-4-pentenoate hydratase/2-oxohepta-3-ene-1,7-dioic acid hydratase in catechol pathway